VTKTHANIQKTPETVEKALKAATNTVASVSQQELETGCQGISQDPCE